MAILDHDGRSRQAGSPVRIGRSEGLWRLGPVRVRPASPLNRRCRAVSDLIFWGDVILVVLDWNRRIDD
jgi:hypothetical protein